MTQTPAPRLILNGKSAQLPEIRAAVVAMREAGTPLEVCVTWEGGDAARFAEQAGHEGVARVIAGGGDGTVHEVVNGLMRLPRAQRPALGILPLGSANDFATALELPLTPLAALRTACSASSRPVDVACLGATHYLNMLSGGFGAEITSSTPKSLKRLLGGGAYSLMGALKAWHYQPYSGRLRWANGERRVWLFLMAIGNGAQAGGGQRLTPRARLDDGLLDVLVVNDFESLAGMRQMLDELEHLPESGSYVDYFQTDWLSFESDAPLPLTLDGEPRHETRFEVSLSPGAIDLLVPVSCPLLGAPSS